MRLQLLIKFVSAAYFGLGAADVAVSATVAKITVM